MASMVPDRRKNLTQKEHLVNQGKELSPSGILKTKLYYVFLLIYITIGGVGMALINHGAMTLQEDLSVSASAAVFLIGIVCLFNGIGRVVWGLIYDRIGDSSCLRCLGILLVGSMLMILLSLVIVSPMMFGVGMGVALLCYGGSSSWCIANEFWKLSSPLYGFIGISGDSISNDYYL